MGGGWKSKHKWKQLMKERKGEKKGKENVPSLPIFNSYYSFFSFSFKKNIFFLMRENCFFKSWYSELCLQTFVVAILMFGMFGSSILKSELPLLIIRLLLYVEIHY